MRSLFVAVTVVSFPFFLASGQTSPRQEKLRFQNEFVRAYEVTLNPGEKTPEHESGNRIIYSLTGYSLRYTWDGKVSDEKRKPADLHFHPAGRHSEENTGRQKASFLIIERTSTLLPPVEGSGNDMAKTSPFNTRVIFDRDQAKVFEVDLYPKDAVGMHFGLHRLVYGLTSYELIAKTPDGKETREVQKRGSFAWHPAGMHAVENRAGNEAKLLVFAFKK